MGSPTHKKSNTSAYVSWTWMKQRCNNPNNPRTQYYREKGVTYDPRWELFENFFADMGECPEGMTLDRYPNREGNYCKENCRWATSQQQALNRKTSKTLPWVYKLKDKWIVKITIKGKRETLYLGRDLFEAACIAKSYQRKQYEKLMGE